MNFAPAELQPAGPAAPVPPRPETSLDGRWSNSRWLMVIVLLYAAHLALLFALGARKQITPRPLLNVPELRLAKDAGEWFALNDPRLFALPKPGDFVPVGRRQVPALDQPSFHWAELTGELPSPAGGLGSAFGAFMQTNHFAKMELQLKPPLIESAPAVPIEPVLARNSMLVVQGDLARRPMLNQLDLPSWPWADVIASSKVQVVVDPAGNVVSAVLLPSDNPLEAAGHLDDADRRALELAKTARFAPEPYLTVGRLIFNWHTVPMTSTNEPGR